MLFVSHEGETRGQPWYTDIICVKLSDLIPAAFAAEGKVTGANAGA